MSIDELLRVSGNSPEEVLREILSAILPESILDTAADLSILLLILGILAGVAQCFFGFKLIKLWTAIVGALFFGLTGAAISIAAGLPDAAVIGITAGAAVVGGLLGYFLWIVGIFFRVLLLVTTVTFVICVSNDLQTLSLIIALATGLIMAILAVAFVKPIVIIYTSFLGGMMVAKNICSLIKQEQWYLPLIIGGVLAVAGIVVQVMTNRRKTLVREPQPDEQAAVQTEQGAGSAVQDALSSADEVREAQEQFIGKEKAAAAESTVSKEIVEGSLVAGGSEESTMEPTEQNSLSSAGGAQEKGPAAQSEPAENPVTETAEQNESVENLVTETAAQEAAVAEEPMATEEPKHLCPSCGAEYKAGAKFCMRCGQKLV